MPNALRLSILIFSIYHAINLIISGVLYDPAHCPDLPNNDQPITMQIWAVILSLTAFVGCISATTAKIWYPFVYALKYPQHPDNHRILPPQRVPSYSWYPYETPWVGPRSNWQSVDDVTAEQLYSNPKDYAHRMEQAVNKSVRRFANITAAYTPRGPGNPRPPMPKPLTQEHSLPRPARNNMPRLKSSDYHTPRRSRYSTVSPTFMADGENFHVMLTLSIIFLWGLLYLAHLALLMYGSYRFSRGYKHEMCHSIHIQRYSLSLLIISWIFTVSLIIISILEKGL